MQSHLRACCCPPLAPRVTHTGPLLKTTRAATPSRHASSSVSPPVRGSEACGDQSGASKHERLLHKLQAGREATKRTPHTAGGSRWRRESRGPRRSNAESARRGAPAALSLYVDRLLARLEHAAAGAQEVADRGAHVRAPLQHLQNDPAPPHAPVFPFQCVTPAPVRDDASRSHARRRPGDACGVRSAPDDDPQLSTKAALLTLRINSRARGSCDHAQREHEKYRGGRRRAEHTKQHPLPQPRSTWVRVAAHTIAAPPHAEPLPC